MYSYIIKINIKLPSKLSRRQRSHQDLKMREHFTEEVLFYFVSVYKFIICINLQRNWRRQWQPTPVLLPGKPHGGRNLVGCSPQGLPTSLSISLSCIGEGNGNPLQYSCLENPRDGGAWWAAVYGVTQSQTQLKQFSSRSREIKKKKKSILVY